MSSLAHPPTIVCRGHVLLACVAALAVTGCAGDDRWSEPQGIGDAEGLSLSLDLATNPAGVALAVWSGDDGVQASAYRPESGWGATRTLSPRGRVPRAALDRDGNGLVVWVEDSALSAEAWTASAWTGAAPVPSADSVAGTAGVFAAGPGRFRLMWGASDGVWSNERTASGWTAREAAASRGSLPRSVVGLAVDGGGGVMAVASEPYGRYIALHGIHRDGTGWHVRDLGYDSPVSVAGGGGGAVFTRFATVPFSTGGMNRFVSGSGWLDREDLSPFIPLAAALGADIGFLIGREDRAIALRVFTSGKPAGESVLQAKRGAQAGSGHIAANASGAARAAWVEFPEAPTGTQNLYAARVFPGPLWGAPRLIESSACSVIDPAIALSDAGAGLLVWAETCGRRHELKSVRTLGDR